MKTLSVEVFKARDSDESYAIRAKGDEHWRAVTGYGSNFEKIWTVDFEGPVPSDLSSIHWEAILDRAVEAYRLSDPLVTTVDWQNLVMRQ
jgi:hypothetical protein